MSRLLRAYSYEAGIVGGAVVILFGLFTAGLVRLPGLQRDVRYHGKIVGGGPMGAYLLGLAFAFGWTPCIGPILGAILTGVEDGPGASWLTIQSVALSHSATLMADALDAKGLLSPVTVYSCSEHHYW